MADRNYWLDLFTPASWQEFLDAGADVSGFRESRWNTLQKVKVGDYFLCYLTGVSRWIGLLDVTSAPFQDTSPIWKDESFHMHSEKCQREGFLVVVPTEGPRPEATIEAYACRFAIVVSLLSYCRHAKARVPAMGAEITCDVLGGRFRVSRHFLLLESESRRRCRSRVKPWRHHWCVHSFADFSDRIVAWPYLFPLLTKT